MEHLRFLAAMLLQSSRCHFSRYSKKKINVQPLHATEHGGGGMKPTQTLHPTDGFEVVRKYHYRFKRVSHLRRSWASYETH